MIISDVIGVCRDVGDLQVFTAKSTGKELKKRDITMVDNRLVYVSKPNWFYRAEKNVQKIMVIQNKKRSFAVKRRWIWRCGEQKPKISKILANQFCWSKEPESANLVAANRCRLLAALCSRRIPIAPKVISCVDGSIMVAVARFVQAFRPKPALAIFQPNGWHSMKPNRRIWAMATRPITSKSKAPSAWSETQIWFTKHAHRISAKRRWSTCKMANIDAKTATLNRPISSTVWLSMWVWRCSDGIHTENRI